MAFTDTSRLHISAENDQVDYISVARNLVDSGTLSSNIIYPSTLTQSATRNYLYMPGHFFALAASYRLLGFGPLQSLLPSILSFVLAAVLIFLVGYRLYDRRTGLLAAFLFSILPANLYLALTAMCELTLVAACLVAFTGFVFTPSRWRPCAAPFLLAVPFVFRETAALLVIPMVTMVLFEGGKWQAGRALVLSLASVAVLTAVFQLDFVAGRPELNSLQYGRTMAMYQDATVPPHPASGRDLLQLVPGRLTVNARRFVALVMSGASGMERLSMIAIVIATGIVIVYGVARWREDPLPLGVGALVLAVFAAVLSLYDIDIFRGLRVLLFTYPLLALCLARSYWQHVPLAAPKDSMANVGIQFALAMVLVVICFKATVTQWRQFARYDAEDDAATAFMNAIGHDDQRMLVAPFELALEYVSQHHPVKWSFIPANAVTLELLRKEFVIGTFILSVPDPDSSLTAADLERTGLRLEQEVVYAGRHYLIFKQP
jgi:hypothetical protein